ncbi:uncharacterized protein K02A2.6-like [Syngnathus typhle]|uniref:uncharacterized protein K02A2.6-like n=1 Tax=Syngnathus typhle TaxID=161592 RepID=UPI002A6AB62E|nr:uncharacterized protein K02A2.6-like [Syngnathus typhle]
METCRSAELAKSQIQAMQASPVVHDASVDALNRARVQTRSWDKNKPSYKKQVTTVCRKCGNKHEPRQCPAYGAVCHKCGKNNHFSKVCRGGYEKNSHCKTKTVNNLEKEMDCLYIGMIGNGTKKSAHQTRDTVWHETATIRGVAIDFKLDTGADANVLPRQLYQQLPGPVQLRPTKTVLIAFGGARLTADGVASLECRTSKRKAVLDFHVSSQADKPILGGEACEELQLVKRMGSLAAKAPQQQQPPATKEELLLRYADVFTGLGEFPGVHHIHVDPSVTPVIHACRNVPLSIMDALKVTIKDLQNRKVITPVNEPTEWVNSLVATKKKNGSLRVCLDPCNLNEAVKRQHYSIPTPEDVRSRLAGKSIFSILDEKDGYWQIKLDEPSSKLCTFNTPWGRFRFLRLPFGIKSASEVFQQKNCETFGDIPGVYVIADDMIKAASSEQEHDEILQKVMERAKSANVKFNKEKIQFKVNTVKYMGHIITAAGQRADDAKTTACNDSGNLNENPCDERVVYALEATDALSSETLSQLKSATAADGVLQAVCEKHLKGWPMKKKSLDSKLHSYWPMRDNISIVNDIVMVGDKIIIPECFKRVILEKLHLAHQGVQRTKAKARKVLYWPGMTRDIETMVEKCVQCQQLQPKHQAEPLIPHQVPELPWMKVGADIFELHGQSYLLLVDCLTKYPEVLNLTDKTARTVIQKMKSVFARHGIPKEVVSDHVPFASYEMQSFAASWEFKLTHSSPGFPSSNGMAERAIKTVKHALKKAVQTGTDPHLVLLSLRNTPVTGLNLTPAQMLMGRVLRSTLPCSSAVLKQSSPQHILERIQDLQSRHKQRYDQRAKQLPVLTPGDTVHMQTRRGWEPAVVIRQRDEPRSYTVQTPAGRTRRRNRRHLRKIHPSLFKDSHPDEHLDSEFQHTQATATVDSPPLEPVPRNPSPVPVDGMPTCYTRSGRAVRRPARYTE